MRLISHALMARLVPTHRARHLLIGALGFTTLLVALAACAPAAGASVARRAPPTPTPTILPTATATVAPTPTFTPAPPPTVVPPAPKAPSTPPILDLRPASMSIVGHLDCVRNGIYVCQAEVVAPTSNQTNLNWRAFTNVPGGVTFSPSSGALAPGHMQLITIDVPFNACTSGLFFFRGPANTHTIDWAC